MKFRSGISRCGTNRTSISGLAIRRQSTYYRALRPYRAGSEIGRFAPSGWRSLYRAARRADRFIKHCADSTFLWTSSLRTFTARQAQDVFSTHEDIPRTGWYVVRSRKFMTRSRRPLCRDSSRFFSEFNASYRMSRTLPMRRSWVPGWRTRFASVMAWSRNVSIGPSRCFRRAGV